MAAETKNEKAWKKVFDKYGLKTGKIGDDYSETISADEIKKIGNREPRLMTKFDHKENVPECFAKDKLSILPISRGKYIISHAEVYHTLEKSTGKITSMLFPKDICSLDPVKISSESIALSCAYVSGIIADFLGEKKIKPTLFGRMGSGCFEFSIDNQIPNEKSLKICVNKAQIEIDATYEGLKSIALFEAKMCLPDDFHIRQLYYPSRLLKERKIKKKIRPVFMVYSNRIFHLFEYQFADILNYSSIELVQQKHYAFDFSRITQTDIEKLLDGIEPCVEDPNVPFPQADKFENVINLCELLREKPLSENSIARRFSFKPRQARYYSDAARYLGLVEKTDKTCRLTKRGNEILNKPFKERLLSLCKCILEHDVFKEALKVYLKKNSSECFLNEIIKIMKRHGLKKIKSDVTRGRRAQTVKRWIEWIDKLQDL